MNSARITEPAEEDQQRRWENEIHEFFKLAETETTTGNHLKNNNTWIKVAQNRERWIMLESECARTTEDLWTMRNAEQTHHTIHSDHDQEVARFAFFRRAACSQ